MAQEYIPTPVGLRLAAERKLQGLSAEALVRKIDNARITRSVIANIESGRKADPSFTEIAILASGLRVSPLELFIDTQSPWAPIDIEGLIAPYNSMTMIEYAAATSIFLSPVGTFNGFLARWVDQLLDTEEALYRHDLIGRKIARGEDWGEDKFRWFDAPTGRPVSVYKTELRETNRLDDAKQLVVDQYRELLEYQDRYGDHWMNRHPHPPEIRDRVNVIAARVVEFIREYPEVIYGQDDDPSDAYAMLQINPQTGHALPRPKVLPAEVRLRKPHGAP